MAWFFKSYSTQPSLENYPDKMYRMALCTRKHCTESCKNKNDIYKMWALFLSGERFEQSYLIKHITQLPSKLRIIVYIHFIGCLKTINTDEYTNYIKDIKEIDTNSEGNKLEQINQAVLQDRYLVIDIFKLCKQYNYPHEENIFNIYKKLEKSYTVDKSVLNVIFNLILMNGADENNVYTIVDYCFNELGLNEIYSEPKFHGKSVTNGCIDKTEVTSAKQNLTVESLKANIKKNTKLYEGIFNIEDNDAVSESKSEDSMKKPISRTKCKEMIQLIFNFYFDTFLTMLDVALVNNLTFQEIIYQAIEFSTISEPDLLIKVLGARPNLKYYKPNKNLPKKKTTRTKVTYFDFLVIQNELIKAQENIKAIYEQKISELQYQLEILNSKIKDSRPSDVQDNNVKKE